MQPSCNIKECVNDTICQICPASKQTRLSFPHSSIKSLACFELLHLDIWGPYQTKTPYGGTLFLTIVNDFSYFTWVHLLKKKSDIVKILHNFDAYVHNQFQSKIKAIRTDNAKEFCEGDLKTFCSEQGILHQTSCTYTPQQNGVVE